MLGLSGLLLFLAIRQSFGRGWGRWDKLHWRQVSEEVKFKRAAQKQRADEETLERLLGKVHEKGLGSLSKGERRELEEITERKKGIGNEGMRE